jgi:hypothetical protein
MMATLMAEVAVVGLVTPELPMPLVSGGVVVEPGREVVGAVSAPGDVAPTGAVEVVANGSVVVAPNGTVVVANGKGVGEAAGLVEGLAVLLSREKAPTMTKTTTRAAADTTTNRRRLSIGFVGAGGGGGGEGSGAAGGEDGGAWGPKMNGVIALEMSVQDSPFQ